MKVIVKREFMNYIRNPVLWIAFIVILWGVYQEVSPYLQIRYFQSEEEVTEQTSRIKTFEDISDADVMQGYARATEEQTVFYGMKSIQEVLAESFDLTKEEAAQVTADVLDKNLNIEESCDYLEEKFGYSGWDFYFKNYDYCPGTMESVNGFIREKLDEHPFSWYIAMKFADFAGLYMGFAAAVLLAFLFIRDTKKDTYELLHTKPVSACSYILGKAGGGMAVILLILAVLNLVFGVLCVIQGNKAGFPVSFLDFPKATLLYIMPNMLMIVSVYSVMALIFRNPLPAAPFLFLHMIYSNMGTTGPDGSYDYTGRFLAIMVRFPGRLFEITPPPMWMMNQIFLAVASVILLVCSVNIWKRRRYY
ncbi:MAG: ABC transporter permease subunit [Eubacteriales bacterium]|nr:ABC transporter permease subunit [Eubacteriales bacterium]